MDQRAVTPPDVHEAAELVTLASIRDASARIERVAVRTPLLRVDHAGEHVWLKCESLQPTGAFKIRGAYNFIARLDPAIRARGVLTYSSGNHAQAVAYAARHFGVPATVVMPVDAPASKIEATRRLGARIELCGTLSTERRARTQELAEASEAPIVPPFDHPEIIAGQGTVGLEIVQQLADSDEPQAIKESPPLVLVPIGGGGLISGIAAALRELVEGAVVVGVEPVGAAAMKRSLEAGAPVLLERVDTIADGLRPVTPGRLTFAHCGALVDRVVTVSDEQIRRGVQWCFDRRLVVEPSGAAGVAAMLEYPQALGGAGRPLVIVLSGGNVGWRRLRDLLDAVDATAARPRT